MQSRTTTLLAAALTAATLTLTACSGSDSKPDDKIEGADKRDKADESSAPPSDDAKRPKIKLPSDITYKFDWGSAGGGKKDAVLHDIEEVTKAVDMAIVEQKPLHKAFLFYTEGPAAASGEDFIQAFVDHKDRTTGFTRYYDARVNLSGKDAASAVYCEDQSKSYNKSLKTGKVDKTSTSKDSYVLYAAKLRKNDQGIWITEELTSTRGAAQCQP